MIKVRDVMGDLPHRNPKLEKIIEEIKGTVGWGAIKTAVDQMLEICDKNYELQLQGNGGELRRGDLNVNLFDQQDINCL